MAIKNKHKRYLIAAVALIVFALPAAVISQQLTQGYSSDESLLTGHVVNLDKVDPNKVERISAEVVEEPLGVVVRAIDTALTLTNDQSGIFVATSGRYDVLFSDINGDVQTGEYIAISPLKGIAMRSDSSRPYVIGRAAEASNLGDPNNVITQSTVVGLDGNETDVAVGKVLVDLDIQPNPFASDSNSAPEFLVQISENVAGKPVTALRIYAGLAILLIASTISGTLLYSAVKSSIISVGRNPLSKKSVLAGLAQVVVISVIIFLSSLFAVYLILKI